MSQHPAPGTQQPDHGRLRLKTRVFTAIVVASNVLGNYSLAIGLRRIGRLLSGSPLAYIEAMLDPWVAVGVGLLVLWLLSRMALFSWADLSYVLPITSIGYVLAALAGKFFLNEQIGLMQWAGIVLITGGVTLVGDTHPASPAHEPESQFAEAGR